MSTSIAQYTYEFFENMPEELYPRYLRKIYKEMMGTRLDLENPKKLSEKIQWLKLNDTTSKKKELSDKILAKEWVKQVIPEINTAQIYYIAKSFDEINFDILPNQFVIKTNHACSQVLKVLDKNKFLENNEGIGLFNIKKLVNMWLSRHYAFYSGFELQYKDIDRKVLIEEFMGDSLTEYKVTCFNGNPEYIEYYKNGHISIYNCDWQGLELSNSGMPPLNYEDRVERPQFLEKMLEYAKTLSKDFKFVRVDFFEKNGNIYFGEMTFTPSSGFIKFYPSKYDEIFGNLLQL